MPSTNRIVLLVATVSVLILASGPSLLHMLARGAAQGRHTALLAAVGPVCGVLLQSTFTSLGIAALFRSSHPAFQIVK